MRPARTGRCSHSGAGHQQQHGVTLHDAHGARNQTDYFLQIHTIEQQTGHHRHKCQQNAARRAVAQGENKIHRHIL
jgi:hypothetical protein